MLNYPAKGGGLNTRDWIVKYVFEENSHSLYA